MFQNERRLGRSSGVLRSYRIPGYQAPIWLRNTAGDHSFLWQCIVVRQYAIETFPQTERLLSEYDAILSRQERPVILDAGGNIGLAAVWFACAFPSAVVVSVEPERHNFAVLTRNVADLRRRVIPVLGAVAERRKRVKIVNPDAGSGAFRVEESTEPTSSDHLGYTVD